MDVPWRSFLSSEFETEFQTISWISVRRHQSVFLRVRRCRWQLCRAFNCRILYGLYLPTVILYFHFHSRLKTFLFCKSFPPQPFLFLLQDSLHGFPRLFTVISQHICFVLLVCLFLHFLVVGPCCRLS